jgi:hypothetical protein
MVNAEVNVAAADLSFCGSLLMANLEFNVAATLAVIGTNRLVN